MKIVTLVQQNCSFCEPHLRHIRAAAAEFNISHEQIDITDNWDIAIEWGATVTPTSYFVENESKTKLNSQFVVGMLNELRDLI